MRLFRFITAASVLSFALAIGCGDSSKTGGEGTKGAPKPDPIPVKDAPKDSSPPINVGK